MVIKDCHISLLPYISRYLKQNYLEPMCPNKEESTVLFFYLPNVLNINQMKHIDALLKSYFGLWTIVRKQLFE